MPEVCAASDRWISRCSLGDWLHPRAAVSVGWWLADLLVVGGGSWGRWPLGRRTLKPCSACGALWGRAWDHLWMRGYGSEDRVSTFRVLGVLRRAAKANRRPVIAADVARERYEPLVEVLAGRLAMEFGLEWRRSEVHPQTRRRAFQSARWVIEQPLTRFPGWERRLDTTVAQVFDIVGAGTTLAVLDAVFEGLDVESASGPHPDLADDQHKLDDIAWFDGDEPLLLPLTWTVRDRLGGDINVTVQQHRTSLWATASVKPR